MRSTLAIIIFALSAAAANAQSINAVNRDYSTTQPFVTSPVASFDTPWAIAFLPDGRLLVTEKPGHMFLVSQSGRKTPIENVPAVAASGQNGLLDVAVSPNFRTDRRIYISYVAPGEGGNGLALAQATLAISGPRASLQDLNVVWRQTPRGNRGQPGGIIAFDPTGTHLFLTSGDGMMPSAVQDQGQTLGKLLRLNLDGSTPSENPNAQEGGVRAQTWTTGHRNPYGLAFAPDGKLWLHEMGPRGGDEVNLIQPGLNYGWPLVSNGDNYSGTPIPRHSTRPEFSAPVLYWDPVIAPAGLAFYNGQMFPQWRGSALIGGLVSTGLVRLTFSADGAVWIVEDDSPGRLHRLTPFRP